MPAAVNAHSRLLVSVPLCLLALALALVAFNGGRTELASKHSLKAAAKVRMSQLSRMIPSLISAAHCTAPLFCPQHGGNSSRRDGCVRGAGNTDCWLEAARVDPRQEMCQRDHRQRQAPQAPARAGQGCQCLCAEIYAPYSHQGSPSG